MAEKAPTGRTLHVPQVSGPQRDGPRDKQLAGSRVAKMVLLSVAGGLVAAAGIGTAATSIKNRKEEERARKEATRVARADCDTAIAGVAWMTDASRSEITPETACAKPLADIDELVSDAVNNAMRACVGWEDGAWSNQVVEVGMEVARKTREVSRVCAERADIQRDLAEAMAEHQRLLAEIRRRQGGPRQPIRRNPSR